MKLGSYSFKNFKISSNEENILCKLITVTIASRFKRELNAAEYKISVLATNKPACFWNIKENANYQLCNKEEFMVTMKSYFFVTFVAIFAIASGVFVPPRPGHKKHNLGSEECTWGPTYWCKNLTAAADCHAVHHCIDTVWIHRQLPPDNSNVCQICLDMVKQARDNLQSNETEELIKEVFEGSCALIHLKPIVAECDKIVDNYIPELVDTLASQMNPQVVCSVAGLCNNENVQKMLTAEKEVEVVKPNKCNGCHKVVGILEDNFTKMSKDEVLHSFLRYCGKMGSFSDGCSNIIITYFTEIYSHLQEHLNPNEVCLMSGECSAQFHTHAAKVEITPMSHIGYVPVNNVKEDLPCELCEQLVGHLKDLLIANTTEDEFKRVLEGLCKQTGKFADECSSLVEQYYSEIYNYLLVKLNSSIVCDDIGICNVSKKEGGGFIVPLLPSKTAQLANAVSETDKPVHVNMNSDSSSVKIMPQQLPLELLMPPHTQILYNKQVCVFCEYFLHYCQVEITDPKTETKIKQIIDEACQKLPSSVNATCVDFVDNYEPALVAILAQEIDPSVICPLIRACPSSQNSDVEIFMEAKGDSKCPLCLLTVTKLESIVKSDKTEESIKKALDKLCHDLPGSMVAQCDDFVETYTNELIELLMSDLNPKEVCVFLKMCEDIEPAEPLPPYVFKQVIGNIETNIIPDNTINGHFVGGKDPVVVEENPQCVICEYVMKEIDDKLKDNKTEENIENIVRDICNKLPGSINAQCNNFVDEYGDAVIQLLISALEPSDICRMIKLCTSHLETIRVQILECPICEMAVEAMEKILNNPKADHEIEHVLEKTCRALPKEYRNKCAAIIEEYGDTMIDLLVHYTNKEAVCRSIGFYVVIASLMVCEAIIEGYGDELIELIIQHEGPKKVCREIMLCSSRTEDGATQIPLGVHHCTYGPSYWCQNEANADECNAKSHCEMKVWFGSKPNNTKLLGVDHCTRGPGYWCQNEGTAKECGVGAKSHCEMKVWFGSKPKNVKPLGVEHCTRGPGYWCQNEETANECGVAARLHCQIKIWNKIKPEENTEELIGGSPCVRGPGYWCKSEENAGQCGKAAREYCQNKVWSKPKRNIDDILIKVRPGSPTGMNQNDQQPRKSIYPILG
ncbi:hypothetical protein JTB14_026510 [Gonioctena quinquepunctata]|nr:hypothetical protein JTB14_026510 [Gonioctena quinquepunctata]